MRRPIPVTRSAYDGLQTSRARRAQAKEIGDEQAAERIPAELRDALSPILKQIASLSGGIRDYDRQVIALCSERYPETWRLRQVAGGRSADRVCFVLTLEDPSRFVRGRDVGAYLGLTPRKHDSGEHVPELRISKAGDATLRRLLVGAAHYVLGPFGPDTALLRSAPTACASLPPPRAVAVEER
jgi:transposase